VPVALLALAIIFVVTAIKGNQNDVATQFNSDITGSGGFFVWVGALLLIAVGGRLLGVPKAGKVLIILIIAVYVISQNGVFSKLSKSLSSAQAPAPATTTSAGAETNIPGAAPTQPTPVAPPDTGTPPAPPQSPFGSLLGSVAGVIGLRKFNPSPAGN
jgi:type III secretory pathway component EscV